MANIDNAFSISFEHTYTSICSRDMQIFTDVCHSSMTAFVFVTEEKKRELVVGQAHFHSLRSGFFFLVAREEHY